MHCMSSITSEDLEQRYHEDNNAVLLHHILRKLSTPFVQHIFTKPSETILIQCQLLPLSELHKRQLIPIGLRWHFHQAIVNHPDTDIFCKLTKQVVV
ncbi:hypothetical protein GN956_G2618 [Arapaima gigas]